MVSEQNPAPPFFSHRGLPGPSRPRPLNPHVKNQIRHDFLFHHTHAFARATRASCRGCSHLGGGAGTSGRRGRNPGSPTSGGLVDLAVPRSSTEFGGSAARQHRQAHRHGCSTGKLQRAPPGAASSTTSNGGNDTTALPPEPEPDPGRSHALKLSNAPAGSTPPVR